jgi:cyclopropane fatty-acyl-phospholipid synthase-like methyltransferase
MKRLENWDNKTWLSSKKYINAFNIFLKSKIKFNKNTQILDIGCGRANIISALQAQYRFNEKPIGVDIVKNKNIKKNIVFNKTNALSYLRKTNKKFDFILIKQTIHFFSKKELDKIIILIKKKLKINGKIFVFSIKSNQNELPTFKVMKKKLNTSLLRNKYLTDVVKKNFIKYKKSDFKFKVFVTKETYVKMVKKKFISCLLNLTKNEIEIGVKEIQSKYKKNIKFSDNLECLIYQN